MKARQIIEDDRISTAISHDIRFLDLLFGQIDMGKLIRISEYLSTFFDQIGAIFRFEYMHSASNHIVIIPTLYGGRTCFHVEITSTYFYRWV